MPLNTKDEQDLLAIWSMNDSYSLFKTLILQEYGRFEHEAMTESQFETLISMLQDLYVAQRKNDN